MIRGAARRADRAISTRGRRASSSLFERGWPAGGYERIDALPRAARAARAVRSASAAGRGLPDLCDSDTIRRIIRAYDDPVVRAYCWVRFGILRQRFLDEIGQYLPDGRPGARHRLRLRPVLALLRGHRAAALRARPRPQRPPHRAWPGGRPRAWASTTSPTRRATPATSRATARWRRPTCSTSSTTCRRRAVPPLLAPLRRCLPPGGRLLVKDVDTQPGAQALVHVAARPGDGAAHAGALLERGGADAARSTDAGFRCAAT